MDPIDQYVRAVRGRIVGRLFSSQGTLHLVLDADPQTGLARVSRRHYGTTEFVRMPVAEVLLHLAEECRRHAAALRDPLEDAEPEARNANVVYLFDPV